MLQAPPAYPTPRIPTVYSPQRQASLNAALALGLDQNHLMFALLLLRRLWAQEMSRGGEVQP